MVRRLARWRERHAPSRKRGGWGAGEEEGSDQEMIYTSEAVMSDQRKVGNKNRRMLRRVKLGYFYLSHPYRDDLCVT